MDRDELYDALLREEKALTARLAVGGEDELHKQQLVLVQEKIKYLEASRGS